MGAGESKSVPEEILVDILKRLPVKTLVSFKSVCKSWESLISTPDFIELHLISNDDVPYDHLIVNNSASEVKIVDPSSTVVTQFRVPRSSANSEGQLQVVGSFNGLICVYHCTGSNEYFYLWNPALGIVKTIDHRYLDDYYGPSGGRYGVYRGFVPDPNYDFKLVRITTYAKFHRGDNAVDMSKPIADIYSIKTNSWRHITAAVPRDLLPSRPSGVYLNGALHWLNSIGIRVISFDVNNAVFGDISLPSDCSDGGGFVMPQVDFVFNCQDLLGVSNCIRGRYNIWVMNEYGVVESWCKLFMIDLSHDMVIPAFWKVFGCSGTAVSGQGANVNGQVLVKEYAGGIKQALVCMDFQHMTSFEILRPDVYDVTCYRMSLLTFDCIGLN